MIKYPAVAFALKCFSCAPQMRGLYRALGNSIGGRQRHQGPMPSYYPERVRRFRRLNQQYGILRHGDRVLEIGTGWLHWEALSLRLFFDTESVLFDVWDNRQLGGLKNYTRQLSTLLQDGFGLSAAELTRVRELATRIDHVQSFDELYRLLGFTYVLDGNGSMAQLPENSFQLATSGGVLEHVDRSVLPALIRDSYRVLQPGGWAVHSIDPSDHLSHYDLTANKKHYISTSETAWRWLYDNQVQGINRVQKGEWLELFRGAGFEIVAEDYHEVDISRLKIAPQFEKMDRRDLATTAIRLTMRKPARG